MRGTWHLPLACAVAGGVLLVSGFLLLGCSGSNKSSRKSPSTPPAATTSYGNAKIKAKALGGPYQRTVVVRVNNKQSGIPLHDAKVTVHGEMTTPRGRTR